MASSREICLVHLVEGEQLPEDANAHCLRAVVQALREDLDATTSLLNERILLACSSKVKLLPQPR